MSFMESVQTCLSKYANFSGRARRSEYWYFYLFTSIVSAVLGGIGNAIGITWLAGVTGLALIVPSLAVGVRRLHDIGKAGIWILIALIPCIGEIILLVWTIKDSDPGDNEYGPNPKGNTAAV